MAASHNEAAFSLEFIVKDGIAILILQLMRG